VAVSAVAVSAVAVVAAGCGKKDTQTEKKPAEKKAAAEKKIDPCPKRFRNLELEKDEQGKEIKCKCTAADVKGRVWGNGIYTTDSSICGAAVHAGAIPKQGGVVTMKTAPGCKFYLGAKANGVTSRRWNAFGKSFYFVGNGDGQCAQVKKGGPCPPKFRHLPDLKPPTQWTCTCAPHDTRGAVWGDHIYTGDTYVCAAALHAGAIAKAGGKVTLQAAPGCDYYAGSTQNGKRSHSWGKHTSSFFFPGKGDGKCKTLKQGEKCPRRFKAIPGADKDTKWKCLCDASNMRGSLYGDGMYTADSSICRAAVHAGLIKKDKGGMVEVAGGPGCTRYQGTKKNGMTSHKWGRYSLSFYFPKKSKGKCQ
jgi:hypothetical protein